MELIQLYQTAFKFILLLSSLIISVGCETFEGEEVDFRDDFLGTYSCMGVSSYPSNPGDGSILWHYDTIDYRYKVLVEKHADSSLSVIYDLSRGNSFLASPTESDDVFVCLDCSGPPNYVKFIEKDSIYVYLKQGVVASLSLYGKKE